MKRDAVDRLLQLAYLEGAVTTHGLYEKTVAKRKVRVRATEKSRAKLISALEEALRLRGERQQVPQTVGDFLSALRRERRVAPAEVSVRLGLRPNVYTLLEHDRISPFRIPVKVWRKFLDLFRVERGKLEEMIRRTLQVVVLRPSFGSTLARYDAGKRKGAKGSTLRGAAEELYRRSELPLPAEEERKLKALFAELRDDRQSG